MATLPPPLVPGRPHTTRTVALLGALLGFVALVVPASASPAVAAGSKNLVGTLKLSSGSCSGGKISGTYLRMILPSGGVRGPYMSNSDSTCPDQSFTPLAAGTDGGLRIGSYQTTPSPRFSSSGDAKARRITAPAAFYGTSFATATSKVDPQTKTAVPAPSLTLTGSKLSADLRSFAVTWNNQDFNQGAPKPNGSLPGNTRRATGTYDAASGRFTLEWASQVVGGPFDKFTGFWHFEGTFVPAAGSAPVAQQPAAGNGTGASGGSGGTGTGTTSGGSTTTGGTAAVVPGAAPTAAGTATKAAKPGAPAGVTAEAGAPVAAAPATTKVVTTQKWHVSAPVISLAVAIALIGLAALVALTVAERRAKAKAAA